MNTCSGAVLNVVCFALAIAGLQSKDLAAESAKKRCFTVRDSIEMSYFGTIVDSTPDELDDDGVVSPDGRYAVKITHRGVLPEGVREGTIWLFDAHAVRNSVNDPSISVPKPAPLARMTAVAQGLLLNNGDNGNTIFQLQWSEDSRTLTFLGRNGRENRQLFRVDLESHKVEALTPETQDVITYSHSGSTFAYLAGPPLQQEERWRSTGPTIPDITIGTGTALTQLLYPHEDSEAFFNPVDLEIWQIRDGNIMPLIDAKTKGVMKITTAYAATLISLSPDALRAATIAYGTVPNASAELRAFKDNRNDTLQYRVIDFGQGTIEPLLTTSVANSEFGISGRYRAAWSFDGRDIAISETTLPNLRNTTSGEPKVCTAAVVKLGTHNAQCIVYREAKATALMYSLHWHSSSEKIDLRYKKLEAGVYTDKAFARKGSRWALAKSVDGASEPSLTFSVYESLNEWPVLIASDSLTGKSRPVFDPNPQLTGIDMGTVSVYKWIDVHGRTIRAGLVRPPGYVPGKRYPLVIQTHGFSPHEFYRVGYDDTASAGRAIAGRDMMVLQVEERGDQWDDTWEDSIENGEKVYLLAIDQLAAEGLIDPKKVGISGYSHTGMFVSTSITRAPDRFAAAVIANTDPGTLMGHYTYVDTNPDVSKPFAEIVAGGLPTGNGIQKWLERAPSFSSDKIQAAVLFSAADPRHLLSMWELYILMREEGKPVEMQFIRGGQHNIKKPLEVFAHQEMIVDWFDFWLNGHEDSDSTKSEQYSRWQKLREARDALEKSATH